MSTNFKVIQGDTWSFDLFYTDENNTPINISNYTLIGEVRDKPGGSVVCAAISTGNGIELINDGNYNGCRITFSGDKTRKFNYPRSAYQIKIVNTEDTLLDGWIEVDAGVIP
jgi:hypothetical protein